MRCPERVGKLQEARMPAMRAEIEAKANAGPFPPPNKASQGPAPNATSACGITTVRFNIPTARPCPESESAVKFAVNEYGKLKVMARGKPRAEKRNNAASLSELLGS